MKTFETAIFDQLEIDGHQYVMRVLLHCEKKDDQWTWWVKLMSFWDDEDRNVPAQRKLKAAVDEWLKKPETKTKIEAKLIGI